MKKRGTMKIFLLVTMLSLCTAGRANDGVYLFTKAEKRFSKIVSVSKRTYLVTSTNISEITNKGLQQKIAFDFVCNDATIASGKIALATNIGIAYYSIKDNALEKVFEGKINFKIDHIVTDAANHLWFTSMFYGAYMIDSLDNIIEKIKAPAIYSLASTPDNNIWVGTNIGLYKVPVSGGEIKRYEEEGIEGYEIPDNLVEKLFADEHSNIWALLDGSSVFIPGKGQEEIPSYNYVGDRNNTVMAVTKVDVSSQSYLFATSKGIIFNDDLKGYNNIHTGEIHQTYTETAYILADNLTAKPKELKNDVIINITNANGFTWFVTENGLWKISSKKLVKDLKNTYSIKS